jgi:hypothetical protein
VFFLSLSSSIQDPFSRCTADVKALGWGFASAASRAVRLNTIAVDAASPAAEAEAVDAESRTGAVMVPFIDLTSHNGMAPSALVVDTGASFELRATRVLAAGAEVTTDYGALGNDELFADFGFTMDANVHDVTQVRLLHNPSTNTTAPTLNQH